MKTLKREDYQHEKDGRFLKKVLENSAMESIMAFMKKNSIEDIYMYVFRSSYLPVTAQSAPRIHALVEQACAMLELETAPEVYLVRDYDRMIHIGGLSTPFLVISTELLDQADDKTLLGFIASRIAGIQVEHHRALFVEWVVSVVGSQLPTAAVTAINLVLNDWKRCCYFTYDRAFYLATGDARLALNQVLYPTIRDAAPFCLDQENTPFQEQVDFFFGESAAEGVLRVFHTMSSDEPWMPERYLELKNYLKEAGEP